MGNISVKCIVNIIIINVMDIKDVDLNLLRVFHAVLEERNITRAGERIGLSQPATSYALSRLRALFDDPLFVRTSDGMLPTPTAERLALPLGRAMVSIQEVLNHDKVFDAQTSTRKFRLSMSDIGVQVFLPRLCEALQHAAPHVRLSVEQVDASEVEERLRLGHLDFAIGNLPTLKGMTNHIVMFHETYACMTRKRPGLPARRLSREQFLSMSHIAVTSTDASHFLIEETLSEGGLQRRLAISVPHFTIVPEILERTDWVATLPKGVAKILNASGKFAIYPLPIDAPEAESTVHWHQTFDADEGIRWFRQFVVTVVHAIGLGRDVKIAATGGLRPELNTRRS